MKQKLEGETAVVTGASRGLGLAIARLFVREGAAVLGVARDETNLKKAASEFGRNFHPLQADLGQPGIETSIAKEVEGLWGRLDLLVNNAAIHGHMGGLDGARDFELVFQTNVLAPSNLCRALLPLLEKSDSPRVLNVSSEAGRSTELRRQDKQAYRSSKYALNGLTQVWAAALKGRVAVNSICPGWVKTDMGGRDADLEPDEAAKAILNLALEPFEETGKFWKNGRVIPF
jgi:NAD(P)-dependent dehydrogenase (short-subunit alcohol dehydrogenase family)